MSTYSLRSRGRRAILPALVFVLSLGLGACGDDDPTEQTDDIIGTWILEEDEGIAYLEITQDRITVYDQPTGAGCFTYVVYDIEDIDGNTYTLSEEGQPGDFETTIERDDDELIIDGERGYETTTDDVDDLEICSLPVSCADLTLSDLPADIDGSLAEGDLESPSGFFDLYAFEIESSSTVRIHLASNAFDAFLTLLDGETGQFIAENDDFDDFDSRITRTLPAGCYIVMATSFGPGAGAYNLTISEQ